jgi:hypothetical protein
MQNRRQGFPSGIIFLLIFVDLEDYSHMERHDNPQNIHFFSCNARVKALYNNAQFRPRAKHAQKGISIDNKLHMTESLTLLKDT